MDRYPWLISAAAELLRDQPKPDLLSFGCSRGDETLTLRRHFPTAAITGLDINPSNIAAARRRALAGMRFAVAANTKHERSTSFDAIFCLAVLCHGDLTTTGAETCEPLLRFSDFEATLVDFARCLKPGGLLVLHTTNFRLCDTSIAPQFDVVLEARPENLAPDVKFGAHNRLLPGALYLPVIFRKRVLTL